MRGERKSCAAIALFDIPSATYRATWSSCGVSSEIVLGSCVRAALPAGAQLGPSPFCPRLGLQALEPLERSPELYPRVSATALAPKMLTVEQLNAR